MHTIYVIYIMCIYYIIICYIYYNYIKKKDLLNLYDENTDVCNAECQRTFIYLLNASSYPMTWKCTSLLDKLLISEYRY